MGIARRPQKQNRKESPPHTYAWKAAQVASRSGIVAPTSVDYEDRRRSLETLGFKQYADYLDSDMWRQIRASIFARHKTCQICDGQPSAVHHSDYSLETMKGQRWTGLAAVCRVCHEYIHGLGPPPLPPQPLTPMLKAKRDGRCERCGKSAKKGTGLCRTCQRFLGVLPEPKPARLKFQMSIRAEATPLVEGQPCPKCNTLLIKRVPKKRKLKRGQEYYFDWYIYCSGCRSMFMVEDAKRWIEPEHLELKGQADFALWGFTAVPASVKIYDELHPYPHPK